MVCFFILLAQVGTQTACTKGPVIDTNQQVPVINNEHAILPGMMSSQTSSKNVECIHQQPTYDLIMGSRGFTHPDRQMCHIPTLARGLWTRLHDLYQKGEAKATKTKTSEQIEQRKANQYI